MPTCASSKGLSPRIGRGVRHARPIAVTFVEDGLVYRVDVVAGQKTGFYLDQRANRAAVRRLAAGSEVLNAFSYTGGFSLAALAGGAHARRLDRQLGRQRSALAPREPRRAIRRCRPIARSGREADAFAELRKLRDRGAASISSVARSAEVRADRGARRAAPRARTRTSTCSRCKLLRPGGLLATFSCSGGIDAEPLPQDRRRRRPAMPVPTPRSSARSAPGADHPGGARLSRRRLSQGTADPQVTLTALRQGRGSVHAGLMLLPAVPTVHAFIRRLRSTPPPESRPSRTC